MLSISATRYSLPCSRLVPRLALVLLTLALIPMRADESPVAAQVIPESITGLIESHCAACHTKEDPSGGVDLITAKTVDDIYHQGRAWQKAIRVLRDQTMPPATEDQPTEEQRATLADWLEQSLRQIDCGTSEPGHVTIRRLNRVEYANTIRDLFGIDLHASDDLPADPTGHGFDNQGDTLFMPPVLMEKYLDITKRILTDLMANPEARGRLLVKEPNENVTPDDAWQAIVKAFLPRAFRRPVTEDEIERRVAVARASHERGDDFPSATLVAIQSVLLSPNFLFRQETMTTDSAHRLTDHALACRLSYFLWSTMPDAELFDFADRGMLHDPEVLRVQVERMLADPKSQALATDFAAQWFGFRDMQRHEMDIRRFGKFNGLRGDMYEESVRFFDQLFRDDRSILDILDCDYVMVNNRLAGHYGIAGVEGGEIREVPITDRRRGGILGMGSTLAVTSYPTRTSPVLRGKWVLEQLLGTPPPPPPPNVGAIAQQDDIKDGLNLRQRLEQHRQNSACASCHAKMDPIGFGLENFDGIGEWRDQDNGIAIDSSAELPDGTAFQGPEGLKNALIARKGLFVRQMVEKMLVYALGRSVEYYDECTVRDAMDRLEEADYASHVLIHAIVESFPFQFGRPAMESAADEP